jgi:hypothetical protein
LLLKRVVGGLRDTEESGFICGERPSAPLPTCGAVLPVLSSIPVDSLHDRPRNFPPPPHRAIVTDFCVSSTSDVLCDLPPAVGFGLIRALAVPCI